MKKHKKIKWPFTLGETLSGINSFILLILAIAAFWIDSRIRELESQTNLVLDYEVSLESHPIIELGDNDSEYGYILVPFTIKIANTSINKKISVEKMSSNLLIPTDFQNLAAVDNPIVFPDSKSPFPMYLDSGEQKFVYCAIAFPVSREKLSQFTSENEEVLENLLTYDYIFAFYDELAEPQLGVKIITPTNEVRMFSFNLADYIESYEAREYYRWSSGQK